MTDEESQTINIRQLIKPLDPETMGELEPLSGLMLINMPQEEYEAAFARFGTNGSTEEDKKLIGTINHETYHAIQAAASGYGFNRQRRAFAVFNQMKELPGFSEDPEIKSMMAGLRALAGDDPELKRRADRMEAFLFTYKAIDTWDARAAPGDNSLFGALHPAFFRHQAAVEKHEAECNADGLSIRGLLEGSAVAFTHLLMDPATGALTAMQAELATLPAYYTELYALTTARAGERALELLLPAVALALCYSEPNNAYCAMLSELATSPPAGAVSYARKMMGNLPALSEAGAILGTSINLRRAHDSYHIYDKFIDALKANLWGVDAFDLLAEPAAANRVQSLPFALVTSDGAQAIQDSMTSDELLVRMVIMYVALRVTGRRRQELDMRDFQLQWAREVLDRLVNSLPENPSQQRPDGTS
jgi:hypothetical protein